MRAPFWSGWAFRRLAIGSCSLVAVSFCATILASEATLSTAEKEERKAAAEALLEEALFAEVDGRGQDRAALLAKAEALAPDLPAIQWHRGMVFVDGKWTPAEDVAVSSEDRALLDEYVAKRDATENSLLGQFALSKWCQKYGLFSQERAHLLRVLLFDPNHATARARLGFVRVNDEWVGREEIAAAIAEEAKIQASLKKHAGSLYDVVRALGDERPSVQGPALERVRALRDAEAIPALEALVAPVSEEATLAVVAALSEMPEKEASLSLARFAAFSPSREVRYKAAKSLKNRPFDQFVPPLIATMRATVVDASMEFFRRDDAKLVYRQVFYREGLHADEVIVHDLVYANSQPSAARTERGGAPDSVRYGSLDDYSVASAATFDATMRRTFALAAASLDRADAKARNSQLGAALAAVTGEDFGSDVQAWWNWWEQHNELTSSQSEQVVVHYSQSSQSVGYEMYPDRARIQRLGQQQTVMSCFAAGTPILTNRGDVAIEQVRVGDLVLAQDVETGELAFKPVLETTVRPPVEILRLEHEGGSLRTTGGHPFWVSGEGWVHARRLQSGMELHTPTGTVRVSQIVSDGEELAYNLIVADFANYFVGEARILSHDNSSRLPTDAIVPGLAQK